MSEKNIYRVIFYLHDTIYEVYCGQVIESSLFGFIEVSDFIFGETSSVVLDPTEERLRAEFKGVKRTMIPMQEIYRIDVVEKKGKAKITEIKPDASGKVSRLPHPLHLDREKNDK